MKFGKSLLPNNKSKILNRVITAGAVLIFFILLGTYVSFKNKPARLELHIGDNRRVFEGETTGHMTILDALNASSAAGNISIKYTLDPMKDEAKILSLDGYNSETSDKNLAIYLNFQKIDTEKIHSINIKPGDKILVKTE